MDETEIFWRAIELHDPESRDAFVQQACQGDPTLQARVAELLAAYQEKHPLLDNGSLLTEWAEVYERSGQQIGRYKLLEEIGEGGFGIVFAAEQTEPIRRKVALKIIKPGLDSRQVVSRFEAERQALAMMDHPHIARVFDAGIAPSGRPFFVMELLTGSSITAYCQKSQLSIEDRLQLVCDVCHAIDHAHIKGVIHRDIKPSNVLVSEVDGQPVVKVIDFGIAKAIGAERLTDKTLATGLSQFVGTPAYISPEQARLVGADVDTRSDVYSMGVLLYELLTGEPPLDASRLSEVGYDEFRRLICEEEPDPPSHRRSMILAGRRAPGKAKKRASNEVTKSDEVTEDAQVSEGAETLADSTQSSSEKPISRELDWIVMRALEKDRTRRYQSAAALAADIEAFLNDEPVSVGPPSSWYRIKKWVVRRRALVSVMAVVVAAFVFATIISIVQANRANTARNVANERLRRERQARSDLIARESALRNQIYAGDLTAAWQAWKLGDLSGARSILEKHLPDSDKKDIRAFGWYYIHARTSARPDYLTQHPAPILTATLSPDGRYLASGDQEGTLKVWDNERAREALSSRQSSSEIRTLAFSPDSRTLAIAGQDRQIRLIRVEDWAQVRVLTGHSATVMSLSWSPDGRQLVSGGRDNSIRIWDVESGEEKQQLLDLGDVVRCVLWLPQGDRIVAAVGQAVELLNVTSWGERQTLIRRPGGVLAVAVSPDGRLLAAGGYEPYLAMFDLESGQLWANVPTTQVWSLAFSPNSQYLIAGLGNGGPTVWRLRRDYRQVELVRTGVERSGRQRSLIWDRHGSRVLIAAEERQSISDWKESELLGYRQMTVSERCLAINEPMDAMIGCDLQGSVIHRSFVTGQERARWQVPIGTDYTARFSPDNRRLAIFSDGGELGELAVWDVATSRLCWRTAPFISRPIRPAVSRLGFSPDGKFLLLAGTSTAPVRVWNVEEGTVYRDLLGEEESGKVAAISPRGDLCAVAIDTSLRLFHFPSFEPVTSVPISTPTSDLTFSPDGQLLVGASALEGTRVWEVPSLATKWRMLVDEGSSNRVTISPDGKLAAILYGNGVVRFWNLATGRELFSPAPSMVNARWMEFTSDSRLLVVCGPLDSLSPGSQEVYVLEIARDPLDQSNTASP